MELRLKIGVDIDGVLVDFSSAFLKEAELVLGRKIEGVQNRWNFEECLNITPEEVSKVWRQIKNTDDWFLLVPKPFPGVVNYLQDLTAKHEVYFITSRSKTSGYSPQEQSELYLQSLGVPIPTVIANKNKGLVAAALELDYFIDDYVENVKLVMEKSPKTKVYIRDASYNKHEVGPWLHAATFQDFVEIIDAA